MVGRNFCSQRCGRFAFVRAERAGARPVFACRQHQADVVKSLAKLGRVRVERSDHGFVFGAAPQGGEVSHVERRAEVAEGA